MPQSTYLSLLSHGTIFLCKLFSAAVTKKMSEPSVPNPWETLRQRIEEYKDLVSKVKEKEAEHVAIDPDRRILSKLEDLGPELDDEANWREWESRRFDDEIANVDGLIKTAKKILSVLKNKIDQARERIREEEYASLAVNLGTGDANAS